jgi:heavy metal efflux system protein
MLTLLVLPLLYYWLEKRKPAKPAVLAFWPLLLVGTMTASAQVNGRKVSLDSMLTMGLRQNLQLQADRKSTEYWRAMGERTFSLPKTQIGMEYGNINSFNNDTRFMVSQGFNLPSVYKRQKELYTAQKNFSQANTRLQEVELKRMIRENYFSMEDILLRRELLQQLDTAYARLLKAAELRYKTGDVPQIEQTAAEAQMGQLTLQQELLMRDLEILQRRNSYLLRITENLLPMTRENRSGRAIDTTGAQRPLVDYYRSQQAVHEAEIAAQKAANSPDLTLGYNNLSIIGWQSPDGVTQKYYGSGDRFSTVSMMLGIPIFSGALKSRIKAGEVNRDISKIQAMIANEQYDSRFMQLNETYRKHLASVEYYETKGLRQADQIITQSGMSYRAGNISYTEWAALMKQATDIRLGYLDALQALKMASAELEYIKGN